MTQLYEAEAGPGAARGLGRQDVGGGPGVHWAGAGAGVRAAGQEGQVDGPIPPLQAWLVGGIHAVTWEPSLAFAVVRSALFTLVG